VAICLACGGENPDGFRHCGFCGAPLTAPPPERRKLATLVFCDMSGLDRDGRARSRSSSGTRCSPLALDDLLEA